MSVHEHVIPVPAKSTEKILRIAEDFLRDVDPKRLINPGVLDFPSLIEYDLPGRKIVVYPVHRNEMPGEEGLTKLSSGGSPRVTEIWMLDTYYDALFEGGRNIVRARSTMSHELGHALMHTQVLKRLDRVDQRLATAAVLHRTRGELETFRDPEWQAWTFAGAVMMPVKALRHLRGENISTVATTFGTSTDMVRHHIRRLRRQGFHIQEDLLIVR